MAAMANERQGSFAWFTHAHTPEDAREMVERPEGAASLAAPIEVLDLMMSSPPSAPLAEAAALETTCSGCGGRVPSDAAEAEAAGCVVGLAGALCGACVAFERRMAAEPPVCPDCQGHPSPDGYCNTCNPRPELIAKPDAEESLAPTPPVTAPAPPAESVAPFEAVMPVAGVLADDTRIGQKFAAFHRENPRVYAALRELALAAVRRGKKKIGAKALWERLRWDLWIEARDGDDPEFKLNNVFTSRYARLLMESEPELAGAFETRVLRP